MRKIGSFFRNSKVFAFGFPLFFFMVEFVVVVLIHGINGAFYPILNFVLASFVILAMLYFFHYQPMVRKNKQLEEAQRNIVMLENFLSMCSHCKMIKDEERWISIHEYMKKQGILISDGLCLKCGKEKYPEFFK